MKKKDYVKLEITVFPCSPGDTIFRNATYPGQCLFTPAYSTMMLQYFDNHINPLLLRELRQLVRNRFIIVLINLYIAILVLVCLMNVLFQDYSRGINLGSTLFAGFAVVMGFACFLAVVVYTASTTASERINGDLMFTSAMKPTSIVFGKACAGAVLTILLMSITAPFVMLAYLLRGLDIEFVAVTFLGIFAGIQVANAIAICIFSNVKTKVQMSAILGIGFFVMIFGVNIIFVSISAYFRFGGGSLDFWTGVAGQLLFAAAVFALFLSGAVVSIAPPTSNRLLPIRLTVTVIYIGSLLICFAFPSSSLVSNSFIPWVYAWIVALAFLVLIAASERESWSFRVKQTIPRNFLIRTVFFPFYTGSANSFTWLALMGLGIWYVMRQTGGVYEWRPFYWLLFSFDYCITALLIRVCLLPKSMNITPEKTWILVLVQFVILIPGGMLVFFLLFNDMSSMDFFDTYSASVFSSVNPAQLKEPISDNQLQTTAAQYWGLALSLPFCLWFLIRAYRFTPTDDGETLTLEQAVTIIRETDANPLVQSDKERQRKNATGIA